MKKKMIEKFWSEFDATVINQNLELLSHYIGVVIGQVTQHVVFEKVRSDLLLDHQILMRKNRLNRTALIVALNIVTLGSKQVGFV